MPLSWVSLRLRPDRHVYHNDAHQHLILRDSTGTECFRTRHSFVKFGMHLAFTRAHYVLPQTFSRGEPLCHQRSTSCRFCMS